MVSIVLFLFLGERFITPLLVDELIVALIERPRGSLSQ
jgi:hypothetical protein